MSDLKKLLPGVKENEPLAKYTMFRIGGPATYFFVAKTADDLVKAAKVAKEANVPYVVLGGGGNVLVSDNGFDGFVIKAENRGLKIEGTTVSAEAGVPMAYLAQETAKKGIAGLEFAVAVPGTVGGATRGNAGAYGTEMKDVVKRVRVWDGEKERWLSNKECQFSYRHSIVKDLEDPPKNSMIVLEVEFGAKKGDAEKSQALVKELLTKKAATQSLESPSAGCVFKNVELVKGKLELKDAKQGNPTDFLKRELPQEFIEKGVISTGWMIEALDMKGKTMGGAMISKKHGNYVLNTGKAKAEHIIMLMSLMKQQVRDKFGIQLQEEIQLIGFS